MGGGIGLSIGVIVITIIIVDGLLAGEIGIAIRSRDVWLVGIGGWMGGLGGGISLRVVCGLLLLVLSWIVGDMNGRSGILVLMLITTEGRMLGVCPEGNGRS